MATSQQPGAIKKEERLNFLFKLCLDELGKSFMKEIYKRGTGPRNPSESLKDHIRRVSGLSVDEFEIKIDSTIRDLIVSDPSMESFDITAWYVVVQYGCDGLAQYNDNAWTTPGTLENNLKCIKDLRNHIIHSSFSPEVEFYKQLEEMRRLLVNSTLLAKSKFSLDESTVSAIVSHFHSRINNTREKQFEGIDCTSLNDPGLTNFLKNEGKQELKNVLKSYSIVNPASLIAGQNIPMEVAEIYTPLQIVGERGKISSETVCLEDILKVTHNMGMNIILIEGIAGVGKTTIIKKLISDWTMGGTIKELIDFDFIIPVQCRDRFYNSVGRIVSAMMPAARKKFYEDKHMTTCLLGCKTFYILDGVDEITQESEAILTELLEMIKAKNFTMLMTARPEKIKEIYQMIPTGSARVLHLRIDGVAVNNREDFIIKYHAKLIDLGVSMHSNANGLLSYLRTTGARLQDQWTLPLSLTLVTMLWGIVDDYIFSITCPIELSIAIRKLTQVRLEERVVNRTKYSLEIFDTKMSEFLSVLSEIALFGIRDSDLFIPQSEIQRLEQRCSSYNLPSKELFSAFFVQKNSWSTNNIFSFAHKSGQEYFAARYIHNRVFGSQPNKQKSEDYLKRVHDFLSRNGAQHATSQGVIELINKEKIKGKTVTDVIAGVNRRVANPPSMDTYQGTLISLIGLLHYYKVIVTDESAREMIMLLQEAGVTDREHWIMVLNSVKCDPVVAKILIKTVDNLYFGDELGGLLEIVDKDVFAYATLLQHKKPQRMGVVIKGNPNNIPRMEELLTHVENSCLLVLFFDFTFCHPESCTRFKNCVNILLERVPVEWEYRGRIPCGREGKPPKGLEEAKRLWVSLQSSEDAESLFTFLRRRADLQKPLEQLMINVTNLITVEMLQIIPAGVVGDHSIGVFIPDVTEDQVGGGEVGGRGGRGGGRRGLKAVGEILKKLNPPEFRRPFRSLNFPRYRMAAPSPTQGGVGEGVRGGGGESIKRLLHSLEAWKTSLHVGLPSRVRPSEDSKAIELYEDSRRILQTSQGISWGRYADGEIWDMDSWE